MGYLLFNGRLLVIDFYGRVDFHFIVEAESSQKIRVAGRLSSGGHQIPLTECDFIGQGDPPWFIRGISLKFIGADVSWKNLKWLYGSSSIAISGMTLEGKQKDLFLEDEHALIIMQGEMHHACDIFPILILKDRVGAFADLWIDYGNGNQAPLHDPRLQIGVNRQPELEKSWEKDLLETDYSKKMVDTSHYYSPVDKVSKSLLFLLEVGWQVIDWKGNRVCHQDKIDLQMNSRGKDVLIKGRVHYAEFEADVTAVMGAFNRREKFVQIGSGCVGLLPDTFDQTSLQPLIDEGEIVAEGVSIQHNRLGALSELMSSRPGMNIEVPHSLKELCENLKTFTSIQSVSPGLEFQGGLRPYQQAGLDWLAFLYENNFHGLLADDMGLGKTVQVIALLSILPLAMEYVSKPHLIVVPTSLLFNWKNELEKFLPSHPAYLHQGANRSQDKGFLIRQKVIITSYATLRIDLPLLEEIAYQTVILDEAQVIKNPHTQVSLAVCRLQARLRLSITGTPIENNLQELWSHFRFLMPDLLGEEPDFAAEVQAAGVDSRYLQRIKRKIKPFILRRKKEEVAKDLPERIEQVIWVEMSPEQLHVYDSFLAGVKSGLLKKVELGGVGKHRIEILEAILRLRQICCHPLLVGTAVRAAEAPSAKMDALLNDIETVIAEGGKVLVYSQFTSMLQLISRSVQERGWGYAYLDGQTKEREKVVASFQEDPSIPLFLISLKAGGVGLNLTAADYVFLVDPWWNEAVEEQAISRAHRIGRRNTVIARRYVVAESIEEKMMKLKASKRKLVEDIFDEEALSGSLTIDDLRNLLM
jgi:superfamily II DNA or RNA helicase